jgi:preprotein translocase subunit SecG
MVFFLLTAVLLVLLVLIQRGRGSGLAGAFGGPGGHSAFGTKTADVLIKMTAVLGAVFFLLAIVTAWFMRPEETVPREKPAAEAPAQPGTGEAAPTARPEPVEAAPAPPATVPSEKAPAQPLRQAPAQPAGGAK